MSEPGKMFFHPLAVYICNVLLPKKSLKPLPQTYSDNACLHVNATDLTAAAILLYQN
jgi:hypothetical protein